ncbi:Uncharacterised protein [Escherichia coli]|uniref:Uncharacterized protein n=1 Tax=Escherichia coli TaxID=562 RepID=A0A376LF85_ECOLX|nr:Uncharacterised protein [Escherichia coli]
MFKSYFSELSKLDKEDVTLLMDYYHEQSILLERVKSTLQKMKSGNDIKVDIDGYLLEEHFMNELNLSNICLNAIAICCHNTPKNIKQKIYIIDNLLMVIHGVTMFYM